jgi:hypothetical protein
MYLVLKKYIDISLGCLNKVAKEIQMTIKQILPRLVLVAFFGFISLTSVAEETMQSSDVMRSTDYVSGGIGESELELMQNLAKDFDLELVFVQKLKNVEQYIADVNVKIEDANHNLVIEAVADGPFMFVNLVKGKYFVTTEYKGVSKAKRIDVYSNKHQRVVFWWPIVGEEEACVQQMEECPSNN